MTTPPNTKWVCNRCKEQCAANECALMRWETGHKEYICFKCNPDLQETYDEAMRLVKTSKQDAKEPSIVFEYVSEKS